MAHWPQPGLIPRSASRGSQFENIAYFGIEKNLAPELQKADFQEQLAALGLRWCIVSDRERWNDFSEVDAILAVRSFEKEEYTHKPASKLYNSWYAEVPAILGCESAYRSQRRSDLDYIEVASVNDAILAIKRLQDDPDLRRAMVENGKFRFQEIAPAKLVNQWRIFMTQVAIPAYHNWCQKSTLARQIYFAKCDIETQEKYLQPRYHHDGKIVERENLPNYYPQIISSLKLFRKVKRKLQKSLNKNRIFT